MRGWSPPIAAFVLGVAAKLACAVPYAERTALAAGSPVHFPPGFHGDADASWHLKRIFGDSGKIKFRGYFKRDLGGKHFYKVTHSVPHGHALEDAVKSKYGDWKKFVMPKKKGDDWKPSRSKSVFKSRWSSKAASAKAQKVELARRQQEETNLNAVFKQLKARKSLQQALASHMQRRASAAHKREMRPDSKAKKAKRATKQAQQIRALQTTVSALTSQLTSVKQKISNAIISKNKRTAPATGSASEHERSPANSHAIAKLSSWIAKHSLDSTTEAAAPGNLATETSLMEEKYSAP